LRINTDYIIIHCSATPPSMDIGATEIRQWHKARGWRDIGYHHVIRRNGKLEIGRPTMAVGAHAKGFNQSSVGICMVGGVTPEGDPESNFTRAQWATLEKLVYHCKNMYREAVVLGHRDLPNVTKECPSFDVPHWWSNT
jgi:N-acetylmuramoyl-L-alanine amidase